MLAESDIPVIPIPGPSSLTAALSICDFDLSQFIFVGFLPPKANLRQIELERLRASGKPLVMMDTPYRLSALLRDVAQVFGSGVYINLACDLTLPSEHIYRDTVNHILVKTNIKKAEFILMINSTTHNHKP
jgi:16S rRNA (cytidine1402-2'-O)-methyltransferase